MHGRKLITTKLGTQLFRRRYSSPPFSVNSMSKSALTDGSDGDASPTLDSAHLSRGWIVVADIVGYSLKPDSIQRDIATFLVRAVESAFLFRQILSRGNSYSVACTGDGFILVVADDALGNRSHELLRFCEEIQSAVSSYEWRLQSDPTTPQEGRSFRVRMGLDRGAFAFEEIFGHRNAIGTGINLACRLTAIGDEGHILVSPDALRELHPDRHHEHFRERVVNEQTRQLFAFLGEVGIKHDFGLNVYSYVRHGEDGKSVIFGSSLQPRVLERQATVDRLIRKKLAQLESDVSKYISQNEIDPKRARLRLTILAPSSGKTRLTVTAYRHIAFGESPATSDVAYSIAKDRPEGVSAEAYVHMEPRTVTMLPDKFADLDSYCGALEAHHLSKEDILGFRRPCRAFIATPIVLPVTSGANVEDKENCARFVLTLDSLDGLFKETSPEICEIVKMMQSAAEQLATLLELKHPMPKGKERRTISADV